MDDYYNHVTCHRCGWKFSFDELCEEEAWFCPECGVPQVSFMDFDYCEICQQAVKFERYYKDVSCPICVMDFKKIISVCLMCTGADETYSDASLGVRCPQCIAFVNFDADGNQVSTELVFENKNTRLINTNAYYIAESKDVVNYFYAESRVFVFYDNVGKKTNLALTKWNRGRSDVRAYSTEGPIQVENICKGLSNQELPQGLLGLSIYKWHSGKAYLELRQAKIKPDSNFDSSTYRCTLNQLNDCSGLNVTNVLKDFGANQVGTKQRIFNDTSNRKHDLCVVFDTENDNLPVIAFLLTRLLPLYSKVYAI